MPRKKWFSQDELLLPLSKLASRTATGMVVGVCERLSDRNVESLWFINERGDYLGSLRKLALPKYDHVVTRGYGQLMPETDWSERFKSFSICGLEVTGVFCWEVYSAVLWTGLGVLKPDLICNCVKFGPNAWPKVKREAGKNIVAGFGYGNWKGEGGWIDRLKFASLWETRCPIVSSTNSWNLRPISQPICGTWSGLDGQGPRSLWHPRREDRLREIPEKLIVDRFDRDRVRAVRKNKWAYKDAVGEFPPMSLVKYTMLLKMARVEDRIISGREEAVSRSASVREGFRLCTS